MKENLHKKYYYFCRDLEKILIRKLEIYKIKQKNGKTKSYGEESNVYKCGTDCDNDCRIYSI